MNTQYPAGAQRAGAKVRRGATSTPSHPFADKRVAIRPSVIRFARMTGQPKWAAFLARMGEIDGIEIICMSIVAGKKIRAIAKELQTSRTTIYRFINHTPENASAFREARRLGADALVEEGQELIDDCQEDSAAVSKAREQAGFRKWRAGVDNRERYGPPQQQALIQVNIGDALLGALEKHGGPAQLPPASIPEAESELITEGEAA